ncbi:AI-2E family transporter [Fontisphaera persica]|uniref:AI-2E family transporter n=1 Tax=Fontisphaera persica TaxID=2974023 RepID=UPI0024BFF247|nr:AI-2E family transporter [Fontisphaera persica]WCJ60431.1 AI-2E family transporter [Fontisphaera persica]
MLTKQARISYVLMAALLLLIGILHLATLVLTALFGYFALRVFSFGRSKVLALALYVVVVAIIGFGLFYFARQAVVAFPAIAEKTIPAIVDYAQKQEIELPFTDYDSLKSLAVEAIKERFANVGVYVRRVLFEIASLIIGLVVAASLFVNARWQVEGDPHAVSDSLYALVSRELGQRFKTFYRSFATVIGAQIVISAINTALTAMFLAYNHFPHLPVLVIFTFLCGLLPIIGNLMSNTLIIGVGFTISPQMALFALAFLVVIHKLEYFLNSKIIGERIKNPMWLTLLGLVLGEQLMGIPGMILAPVVLHYIKVEASRSKISDLDGSISPHTPTQREPAQGGESINDTPLPTSGATP